LLLLFPNLCYFFLSATIKPIEFFAPPLRGGIEAKEEDQERKEKRRQKPKKPKKVPFFFVQDFSLP